MHFIVPISLSLVFLATCYSTPLPEDTANAAAVADAKVANKGGDTTASATALADAKTTGTGGDSQATAASKANANTGGPSPSPSPPPKEEDCPTKKDDKPVDNTTKGTAEASATASASTTDCAECGGKVGCPDAQKCSTCQVLEYKKEDRAKIEQTWFFYMGTQSTTEIQLDSPACADFHLCSSCKAVKIQYVTENDQLVKKVWGTNLKEYTYIQSNVKCEDSSKFWILKDEVVTVMHVKEGSTTAEDSTKKDEIMTLLSANEYVVLALDTEKYVVMRSYSNEQVTTFVGIRESYYTKEDKSEITASIKTVLQSNQIDDSGFVTLTEQFSVDTNTFSGMPDCASASGNPAGKTPANGPSSTNPTGKPDETTASADASAKASAKNGSGSSPTPSPATPSNNDDNSKSGSNSPCPSDKPDNCNNSPANSPTPAPPSAGASASASASASCTACAECGGNVGIADATKCPVCQVLEFKEGDTQKIEHTWFFYMGTKATKQIQLDSPPCTDFYLCDSCKAVKVQYKTENGQLVKKLWGTDQKSYTYVQSNVKCDSSSKFWILKDEVNKVNVVKEGSTIAEDSTQPDELKQFLSANEYVVLGLDSEKYVVMRTFCPDNPIVFVGIRESWYGKEDKTEITTAIKKIFQSNQIDESGFITLTEQFSADTNSFGSASSKTSVTENGGCKTVDTTSTLVDPNGGVAKGETSVSTSNKPSASPPTQPAGQPTGPAASASALAESKASGDGQASANAAATAEVNNP